MWFPITCKRGLVSVCRRIDGASNHPRLIVIGCLVPATPDQVADVNWTICACRDPKQERTDIPHSSLGETLANTVATCQKTGRVWRVRPAAKAL